MISYREALQNLLSKVTPIGRTETIPTLYAEGRVLAEDIISPVNVPPADNSQMDGYAVRAADLASASPEHPVTLPVSQRIPAGSVPHGAAASGRLRLPENAETRGRGRS